MKRLVAAVLVVSTFGLGCYNTYTVPRSQLGNLQEVPEAGQATVKDTEGKDIVVKEDTRLFVRSQGGKRYPITPFNFKMTESQLVASDRDYILDVNGLTKFAEVDHMSTWKTAVWISVGVALAGTLIGLIAWASSSSGGSSTSGN